MKNVLSVRLDAKTMERLREQARREGKEVSAVARELIGEGWVLTAMRGYREGKLSLGAMASKLGLSVSEALDVLAELGVGSPIEFEEYLEGSEAARALLARDHQGSRPRPRKRSTAGLEYRRSTKK